MENISQTQIDKAVEQYRKNAVYFNEYQRKKRANYTKDDKELIKEYQHLYYLQRRLRQKQEKINPIPKEVGVITIKIPEPKVPKIKEPIIILPKRSYVKRNLTQES